MIQTLIEGLFDGLGLDRSPVKKPRISKKVYPEFIQISIFDVLRGWAESELVRLRDLYNYLYQSYIAMLNSYSKVIPFSIVMKMKSLKSKLVFIDVECRDFIAMWGLDHPSFFSFLNR